MTSIMLLCWWKIMLDKMFLILSSSDQQINMEEMLNLHQQKTQNRPVRFTRSTYGSLHCLPQFTLHTIIIMLIYIYFSISRTWTLFSSVWSNVHTQSTTRKWVEGKKLLFLLSDVWYNNPPARACIKVENHLKTNRN